MIDHKFILIVSLIGAAYISLYALDYKFRTRIVAWCNGESDSPFPAALKNAQNKEFVNDAAKDRAYKTDTLEARVQTLEKIVTEPAFELNQELKKL